MNKTKQIARAVVLTFLFGIPLWLLGSVFGLMFGQKRPSEQKPTIKYAIFDLGNVLIKRNKVAEMRKIGLLRIIQYLATLHNPMRISRKMQETANLVCPIEDEHLKARTPDGTMPLPQIFRDWLSGKYSSEKTLERAIQFIDENPEQFRDKAERKFVEKALKLAFVPENLSKTLSPVKEGIKFVQECKDLGLEVLILSNLDAETYELMKIRYPALFELFEEENIFISAKLGVIKPDPQIYDVLLQNRGLDPQACVFFDDQKENIEAAQDCEINAILCPQKKKLFGSEPNIEHLRQELAQLIMENSQPAKNEEQTARA